MTPDKYYVLSETGFGGPKFRMGERYIQKGGNVNVGQSNYQDGNDIYVNLTTRESRTGKLLTVSARSTEKVNVALIQPADEEDFINFLETRSSQSGKVNPAEIPFVDIDPVTYCLSILAKIVAAESGESSLSAFQQIIVRESVFPAQNLDKIIAKAQTCLTENRSFKFACFVCLNTKCIARAGKPVFYLGQDEKRLTTPKLMRRTQKLISLLEATSIPFSIDILIADTDIYDVNGDWLATPDQTPNIEAYQQKLSLIFSGISPKLKCKLWSAVQAPYGPQYKSDFNAVYSQFIGSTEEQVVVNILKRKSSLVSQGVPDSEELQDICRITAERNFALYAAQGPIINSEYDCLIMADPEPLRLGAKQSLLAPNLPIWYPYSG